MKRWLARRLVWLSGVVSHIKTRQRFNVLVSVDPFVTRPGEVRWSSCRLTYKLLSWGMHLDWDHWPHWGLKHDQCGEHPVCEVCGGLVCDEDDDVE